MFPAAAKPNGVLPGFRLGLGYTLTYLTLLVLIPLAGMILFTGKLTWQEFWAIATDERALASYRITFGASLFAATVNAIFGLIVAS